MPYMWEHLEAGFYASMGVVAFLIAGFHYGCVATQYDVFRLSLLATIFIIIGSDLPDIDAKSAPISKIFQILIPGTVVLVSLGATGSLATACPCIRGYSTWLVGYFSHRSLPSKVLFFL